MNKSWLIGKDSDAGRDWGQEEEGMTEDEMAGWHHWLDGRESEWTPGVGNGQGGLACCDSWSRKESDITEQLNWTELNDSESFHAPIGHLYIFFRNVYSDLLPIFLIGLLIFLILRYIDCLCNISDINSLLVILFTNFSYSVDCVFILLMVSFAVQKLLSLIKFHLFSFAFVSFALGDSFPQNCNICQRVFHLYFSLGVLWHPVLHLGVRCLIHWVYFCVWCLSMY